MFCSFRAPSVHLFSYKSDPDQSAGVDAAKNDIQPIDEGRLSVPVAELEASDLSGNEVVERGRHLARQDLWSTLSEELLNADNAGSNAPGSIPIADLLAYGARSDVVLAAEHALSDDELSNEQILLLGITELEDVWMEHDHDPMIGLVVALAHIDLAWAWRDAPENSDMSKLSRSRCAAHFDRAAVILAECKKAAPNSPAVTSACCALLAGQRDPRVRVANEYEKLISLDPSNYRPMRAMGNHLLPSWFGSYEELELQALRVAALTRDTWGAGGYTWVQFDAIALDNEACAQVDVEYFLEGMRDIVERRPDQEMINLLAAYCAITLRKGFGRHEKADVARGQICEAADWLIRDHLTELHPMIWAHAADGFNNSVRISSPERFAARGHRAALRAISDLFRDELRSGKCVTFTPNGLSYSTH
ncbi:MAG: hypothetical protein ACR2O2_15655 [Ruegeria sp.]